MVILVVILVILVIVIFGFTLYPKSHIKVSKEDWCKVCQPEITPAIYITNCLVENKLDKQFRIENRVKYNLIRGDSHVIGTIEKNNLVIEEPELYPPITLDLSDPEFSVKLKHVLEQHYY